MTRATNNPASKARRKRIFERAKGFYGRRKNTVTVAKAAVDKAGQYAYVGRKQKKRNFRALWIQRINAGARENGMTYSQLVNGLKRAGIELDRKVLADLAARDAQAFHAIVAQAQAALAKA